MLMLSNDNAINDGSMFWVKDMRRTRTRVILASRAAPPHAAGSQKFVVPSETLKVLMTVRRKAILATSSDNFFS